MTRAAALETQETASELPAQVRALGDPFSGSIEDWANRIMTESSNAEVRREALRWKMYAIPTLQGVLLAPDAASAIADTWAFCLQMEQYFEKGAGSDLFGAQGSIAVDVSRLLQMRAETVVREFLVPAEFAEAD